MFHAVSARLFMAKNAMLLPSRSVSRFTTKSSAVMWSPRNAKMCPRRSATTSRKGSVRLWSARVDECQTVPRTECTETSNRQCRSFPKQECTDVPKHQCVQVIWNHTIGSLIYCLVTNN